MLDNNQLKEAFELTNYIFIKVGNQDMDDSDGGTGEMANSCLQIWQEILYKCDIKLKREIVFSKLSPYRGIDKLYELEGLYMVMEYEEILKDIYPKELLNKYENTIKAMATNTSGRAHYREIVSILRRMKKYPKGKEKVSEIVSDWRLRYRNRPAMMDELNKL